MRLSWKRLLITSTFLFTLTNAEPYATLNIDKLLVKNEQGATIDLLYLQDRIEELSKNAGTYPTQFDSEEDQRQATKEIQILLEVAKTMTEASTEPSTLYLSMQIARIGHNLDIKGAAEQTINYADQFIKQTPDDSTGYFFMGAFLAESGKIKEAKPYLDQALSLGNEAARWSIAMSYLFENRAEDALREFKIYQKNFPKDPRTKQMIELINSEDFKIEGAVPQ
ncbi:tetratricopeptide repeat protein [Wohlfahrtiimonas larvae]|uniref:Tetratricopeptide repeat protein n=1 Tax=Wohlfahrtiimonas larvae TaxID=1157986 RepID=A0ABP9MC59_9GAMM|nr:hypothetical protein [Wohlfahrtiimonas larvae]